MGSVEARYKPNDNWRGAERRLSEWSGYSLRLRRFDWICIGFLTVIVVGSVLGIGAVSVPVLIAVAGVAACSVLFCWRAGYSTWQGLSLTALGLAAVCLLQAVPMPLRWLAILAPRNADVWVRAFHPLDLPPPNWVTLSLDPGATWVEVLKWSTYAATLFTASVVRRTSGKRVILFLVFASAVLLGIVSIAHWLAGAEKLFGFYRPRFAWEIGPLLNPNNLAGYSSLGTFCGLGLLLDPERRTRRYRWFLGIAISGLISLVALSGSRAGLASLGLGLVILSILTLGRRPESKPGSKLAPLAPMAAAIAGGAVFAAFSIRPTMIHELFSQGTQKLDVFRWTLPMIKDHLWLGVGRGAFETAFQPYRLGGGNAVFTHAENFLIQWLVEWGAPVTVMGLATFIGLLWPRGTNKLDPITLSAYVGLVTLHAQNLFDLALEVPAVAIAVSVVCGGLIESDKRESARGEPRVRRLSPQAVFLGAFAVLELGGLIGAVVWGRHTAISDRDLLHRTYESVRRHDEGSLDHFNRNLEAAISRHPGDGYLPLLAAITSQTTKQGDTMRWLVQALERDPMNGRAHIVLSEELAKRGARSQALMELRLATERESTLVPKAAALAVHWATTTEDLLQTAPPGQTGADMLVTISHRVGDSRKGDLLREALRRDPNNADAHLDLGMWLTEQIAQSSPECSELQRARCISEIDDHVEALRRLGTGAQWARLKGALLGALGKPEEALRLLHEACPGTLDQRICFAVALNIAVSSNTMLDETIVRYLGSCAGPQDCANSEVDVGDALAAKQRLGSALGHYTRAAQVLHSAEAWLRVAEIAERTQAYAQARTAVERARNDPNLTDPALRSKLNGIEERAEARQLDNSEHLP